MSRDALAEILAEADNAAPPPPMPVGLADRARALAARGARQRAWCASGVLVGCAAALLWSLPATTTRPVQPSARTAPTADDSTAELARLRSEAAVHLAVADSLRSRQRRRAPSGFAGPTMTIESEREKAALALVDHGDRLRRELKQSDAALAAYRRTIELFPDTHWAAVARRRIAQLNPDAVAPHQQDHSFEGLS